MSIAHIWFSLLQNQHDDGDNKAHYFSAATYRTDVSPNQIFFLLSFQTFIVISQKDPFRKPKSLYGETPTQQKNGQAGSIGYMKDYHQTQTFPIVLNHLIKIRRPCVVKPYLWLSRLEYVNAPE